MSGSNCYNLTVIEWFVSSILGVGKKSEVALRTKQKPDKAAKTEQGQGITGTKICMRSRWDWNSLRFQSWDWYETKTLAYQCDQLHGFKYSIFDKISTTQSPLQTSSELWADKTVFRKIKRSKRKSQKNCNNLNSSMFFLGTNAAGILNKSESFTAILTFSTLQSFSCKKIKQDTKIN